MILSSYMNYLNGMIIALLVILLALKINKEQFFPFYEMSPSKRNMSLDLRCEPEIPKKKYPFHNSSIDYYYRPKCLGNLL
jgi:hypothetical protein